MDTIYRKDKYQELVKKINKLEGINPSEKEVDKFELIQNEVNEIIEHLRNRGDQANSKLHYVLLTVPLVLAAIAHAYLFQSFLPNAMILLLIFLGLGLAHYRMNKVITQSQKIKREQGMSTGDTKQFILTKMNFLEQALSIKKSRLLLVALFYIILFPILLVYIHHLGMSAIAFDSTWMAYVVAYLIGAPLWFFYYNRIFESYDEIEASLDYMRSNL